MSGKLTTLFAAQDMTQGSPAGNLIRFSVPLLIGNLAQQLYSTVDSIVVGAYVGDGALAAVGASGPILNLLLVLFMGISVGASVMVSQYFGARDRERLEETVGTTITATVVSSIFIMVVGPLITPPVMSALGTPEEIYDMSCTYLIILFAGIIGSAFYNILSGVLRGLGDSVMPVIFLIIACLLNIVLDVWFVAGFHWDVAGVAIATIISQVVSGGLCLIRLLHMRDVLQVKPSHLRPKAAFLKQLIRLGLPSGLTQAIFSFAMIIVQSLTNSFGTVVIAANTAVMPGGRFCHDAQLYLWHHHDHLHRPEHRRGQAGPLRKGHPGRLEDRPERLCGAGDPDLDFRPVSDADVHLHPRGHLHRHADAADSGGGLHRHGRHPNPLRRDAGRGGHHDPHVDLHYHHGHYPSAHRLWVGVPHPARGRRHGFRHPGPPVCVHTHQLGYGCGDHLHRLPYGPLEEKVHCVLPAGSGQRGRGSF